MPRGVYDHKVRGSKHPDWIPREIRICAVSGCDITFECLITSNRKYCSVNCSSHRQHKSICSCWRCKAKRHESLSEKHKENIGLSMVGKGKEEMVLLWKDPKYRKKQLRAILKGCKISPNKPEKFLDGLFQQLFPNQIKYTGDGKDEDSIVAGRCPDFIFVDGQKKIIEFFGEFWHGEKRTGVPNELHEQERKNRFTEEGYQTLIIWEHELEDVEKLMMKITKFNEG